MFTFRNVRILFAAALLAAIFCLAGCSTAAQAVPQPAETSRSAEATPETAIPAPTSTPAPTATPAPTEAPTAAEPVLTLPILDDIDENVIPGISGSSLRAVQVAVRLLDWGVNTGLGADEIGEAAAAWLAAKGDDQALCVEKLELVDYAYQELLTDEADDLLDVAGCADIHRFWGSEPVESIEAIMQAAGLRG